MKREQINIAVLVSGDGTNLQALINAEKKGYINSGKICIVISNNANANALKRAQLAGITNVTVSKKKSDTNEGFEERLAQILKENKIDLIVLAGFMSILSKNFTQNFENRIINIHPSLIPSFCGQGFYGLKVHEAVLEKGVKVTGATVHFANEIPDDGEIIIQKAVKVLDNDTPESLQKRVMRLAEWKILPLAVEKISSEILKKKGGEV